MPSSWAVVASSATARSARPPLLRSSQKLRASTAAAEISSSNSWIVRMRAPPITSTAGRPARAAALGGKA